MTYLLLIKLPKSSFIKIGKLKDIYFKKGFYLYVGSAKRKYLQRIQRHLSKDKKRFWHIDYLLDSAKIIDIWIYKNLQECQTANYFLKRNFGYVLKFGSSDCRCRSHLFFEDNKTKLVNLIKDLGFRNLKIGVLK